MGSSRVYLIFVYAFLLTVVSTIVTEPPMPDAAGSEKYKRSIEKAALYYKAALNALSSGKRENAKELLRKTLAADPVHPEAVLKLGKLLLEEPVNFHEIMRLYKRWLQAMNAIGAGDSACKETERKVSAKLSDISNILEIDRKYSQKLTKLGKRLERDKKLTMAAIAFRKALELDPNNQIAQKAYTRIAGSQPDKTAMPLISDEPSFKKASLLISESFALPNKNWGKKTEWSWNENGEYYLSANPAQISCCPYKSSFKPVDFFFETVVICHKGKGTNAGGLAFRFQTGSKSYYAFLISAEGKFGLWAYLSDGKIIKDLTGRGNNEIIPPVHSKYIKKRKNLLAVACTRTKIYCFINSHLVLTVDDNSIPSSGRIGIMLNPGNHIFSFDDLKVYSVIGGRKVTEKEIENKEIAQLYQSLKSSKAKERRQAVKRLGRIGGSTAIRLLIEALNDSDIGVRNEAVQSLQKLHPAEATEALIRVLTNSEERVSIRRQAEKALSAIGEPAVAPLIDIAITSEDFRKKITTILAKMGADAVASLITLLETGEEKGALWAAKTLVKIGNPAVMPLLNFVNSSFGNERLNGIWALGEIGDRRATHTLQGLFYDTEPSIRDAARIAIGKIRQ